MWRARVRDDDGRVWRSTAPRAEELSARWGPATEGGPPLAALGSLRPVAIEVSVETPDGRAATRALTRHLVGEGVRLRRWREGLVATLHLPAGEPRATVLVDATGGGSRLAVAALAAPLLASRGVVVVTVGPSRGRAPAPDLLAAARERLAAVPGAPDGVSVLPALDPFDALGAGEAGAGVVLPPGVGVRDGHGGAVRARAAAWDELLARLGARPRTQR